MVVITVDEKLLSVPRRTSRGFRLGTCILVCIFIARFFRAGRLDSVQLIIVLLFYLNERLSSLEEVGEGLHFMERKVLGQRGVGY